MEEGMPVTFDPEFHDRDSVCRMEYVDLGKTGLKVSKISLGSGQFSKLYGLSNEDEEGALDTIQEAIARGINYIDTAYWYGQGSAEKILGKALKSVPRKAFYIGTKVGRYELETEQQFDFSAKKTRESVLRSLENLGLDYVDVIQIHDIEFAPSFDILLNETLPTLEELVKEGKTRFIGVTGYDLATLKSFIEAAPSRVDICLSYSRYTLHDDSLLDYVDFFKQQNIGLICASGHGMGLLTNAGHPSWHPAGKEIKEACHQAADLCKANDVELARLAMDHFIRLDSVATFLSGMQSSKELGDNVGVYLNGLTDGEQVLKLHLLEEVFSQLKSKHWEGVEVEEYRKKMNQLKALQQDNDNSIPVRTEIN